MPILNRFVLGMNSRWDKSCSFEESDKFKVFLKILVIQFWYSVAWRVIDKGSTKAVLFKSILDFHCIWTISGISVEPVGVCFVMSLSNRFRHGWSSFSFHASSTELNSQLVLLISYSRLEVVHQLHKSIQLSLREILETASSALGFWLFHGQKCLMTRQSKLCWTWEWLQAYPSWSNVGKFGMSTLYSSEAFGELSKSGKGMVTPHHVSSLVKYLFNLQISPWWTIYTQPHHFAFLVEGK